MVAATAKAKPKAMLCGYAYGYADALCHGYTLYRCLDAYMAMPMPVPRLAMPWHGYAYILLSMALHSYLGIDIG